MVGRMVHLLGFAALVLSPSRGAPPPPTCDNRNCDTFDDCDASCSECYQPEKGLAWCTTALDDGGLTYNLTVVNGADMDADVSRCQCGRGTDECADAGVVARGANATLVGLRWDQFVYPSGEVCYDYLRVKTGSSSPPQPYFPFEACTLNNTAMAAIWEIAVRGRVPRLAVRGGGPYECDVA